MHANVRHTGGGGQVDSCRKLLLLCFLLFFLIAVHVLFFESSECDRHPGGVGDARWLEVFLRCFVATIMRIIMHHYSCVYDNAGKRARRKRSGKRRAG